MRIRSLNIFAGLGNFINPATTAALNLKQDKIYIIELPIDYVFIEVDITEVIGSVELPVGYFMVDFGAQLQGGENIAVSIDGSIQTPVLCVDAPIQLNDGQYIGHHFALFLGVPGSINVFCGLTPNPTISLATGIMYNPVAQTINFEGLVTKASSIIAGSYVCFTRIG